MDKNNNSARIMRDLVIYTDPEFLDQWAREVMVPVNYGEMSERQVAEFVADASKEAPEWMKAMSAARTDIEAATEMHSVPLGKKPDDDADLTAGAPATPPPGAIG